MKNTHPALSILKQYIQLSNSWDGFTAVVSSHWFQFLNLFPLKLHFLWIPGHCCHDRLYEGLKSRFFGVWHCTVRVSLRPPGMGPCWRGPSGSWRSELVVRTVRCHGRQVHYSRATRVGRYRRSRGSVPPLRERCQEARAPVDPAAVRRIKGIAHDALIRRRPPSFPQ